MSNEITRRSFLNTIARTATAVAASSVAIEAAAQTWKRIDSQAAAAGSWERICTQPGASEQWKRVSSCKFVWNYTIPNGTLNFNVKNAAMTLATAAGWNGTDAIEINLTVAAGTYIGSSTTAGLTFDTGENFPAGSSIRLINRGFIFGTGGKGGDGQYAETVCSNNGNGKGGWGCNNNLGPAPQNGFPGGGAIRARVPITIDNTGGWIAGGGGGGGGLSGQIVGTDKNGNGGTYTSGPGGGGGRGLVGGSRGLQGSPTSGTQFGRGSGAFINDNSWIRPRSGDGGDVGTAGNPSGSYRSTDGAYWGPAVRSGGSPGFAVMGNANITWTASGTIRGAVTA